MFHVERSRPPKPPSTCRAADRLRRRRAAAVPEPQRRRALLQQAQAVARARDTVRQDRPQPPLRPMPCCDPLLGAEHQSVTLTWSGVSPARSGRPREAHAVETSTRRTENAGRDAVCRRQLVADRSRRLAYRPVRRNLARPRACGRRRRRRRDRLHTLPLDGSRHRNRCWRAASGIAARRHRTGRERRRGCTARGTRDHTPRDGRSATRRSARSTSRHSSEGDPTLTHQPATRRSRTMRCPESRVPSPPVSRGTETAGVVSRETETAGPALRRLDPPALAVVGRHLLIASQSPATRCAHRCRFQRVGVTRAIGATTHCSTASTTRVTDSLSSSPTALPAQLRRERIG